MSPSHAPSVSSPAAAPSTRGRRIATFLKEMFPPWVFVPHGLATFAVPYLALQALAGDPLRVTYRAIAGAFTVVLFLLLMRLYDELKDVETDLRLGQAGDPRYAQRPIVTGRVLESDLVFLRWTTTFALFAINLPLGRWPLLAFGVLFGVTWLSFKWFFCQAISKNLLLAFITHNPIALLMVGYIVAIYVADFGPAGVTRWVIPLAIASWLPVAAWETSRKVRHPSDETSYQTYSMMLGYRTAGLVPALFLIGAASSLWAVAAEIGTSPIYLAAVGVASLLGVGACARFVIAPSTRAAKLQPIFELFGVVATVGFVIAVVAARGVALGS